MSSSHRVILFLLYRRTQKSPPAIFEPALQNNRGGNDVINIPTSADMENTDVVAYQFGRIF
jgi:hypothetical protein